MQKSIRNFSYRDLYGLIGPMIRIDGELPEDTEFISGNHGWLEDEDGGGYVEIYNYWVIAEDDAEFLMRYTKCPILHDDYTGLYFYGRTFYGSAPEDVCAYGALTEDGVNFIADLFCLDK